MSKIEKPAVGTPQETLLDLVPPLKPYPWEDAEQCAALESAVLRQLMPGSVHEEAVARQIADCIWEQYRSRDLERCVTLAAFNKAALRILLERDNLGGFQLNMFPTPEMQNLVSHLVSDDSGQRSAALAMLETVGIDEAEIRARAYLDTYLASEALHRRPNRLDDRRRCLMKEYEMLQVSRISAVIEDAEMVEEHDN